MFKDPIPSLQGITKKLLVFTWVYFRRYTKFLLIALLAGSPFLKAAAQEKSNKVLRSVDIEFTYTADGKNIRKNWPDLEKTRRTACISRKNMIS